MCGIVGVLAHDRSDLPDASVLARMRDSMAHRGPDGAGLWYGPSGRIALGHRRLAIIDLTPAADQPMLTSDGRYAITFNGEIYNHGAIRRELESLGERRWQTDHSDTEVILLAFARWGIQCLHRLRGMFAFAIWDDWEKTLWLARDRIGVKPLYFAQHSGRTIFASEIKAILEVPGFPREVDEVSLFHFLSFLVAPAPRTLFQHVQKLEAGTWMRVGFSGSTHSERYWDAWDNVDPIDDSGDDSLAAGVLQRLDEAVQLRKVADVPIGIFLSGGVDSSTNAVLFSRGEAEPVRTFSIGYVRPYPSYESELEHARTIAAVVGAAHHELLLASRDVAAFLPRMIELQDEPIADPVCVPVHYLSQFARDRGATVCQVGEGADELFGGYTSWHGMMRLGGRLRRQPTRASLPVARLALKGAGGAGGFRAEYLQRAAAGRPIFWGGAEAFTSPEKQALLSHRLRSNLQGLTSWDALAPIYERYQSRAWEKSDLHWMSYLDLNLRLPELLLMRVDKMSMGASLECRVPFLDHAFVSHVLSIPTSAKLRLGRKGLLRHAVRGIVPDEIIDRPKQGFALPVADMLSEGLGTRMADAVGAFCQETDLLDQTAARALLAKNDGRGWYLFNLALWWDSFIRTPARR